MSLSFLRTLYNGFASQTDINWAELDGRLRRLSSSNEHKGGSMKDELEMRRMQARELKRLAAELRNRLRHSEMRRVVGRGSASQAKAEVEERLEVAVDDFRSMEASVNHLQEQVRQHAGEIEAKETTIVKQAAEVQALKRKVTQQSEDLAVIREELTTSKKTHLADIRAAKEACDLLRSRVAKEQAHSEGIRQQLHGVRATVSELQEALTAQKKLAKQASRDLEDAQVGKAAVEQTRRLYEDAKYEADRFRREAARLAKLLGQVHFPARHR
jgi:chromosome segregation ATPase